MNQFRRYFYISILMAVAQFIVPAATNAQMLTLDQCKDLALKNNKQIAIARMKQNSAKDAKDIARTQYLPKVSAVGSYLYTSKEISLLNDNQKATLGSLGTTTVNNFNSFVQGLNVPGLISDLAQQGIITAQQAAALTKGLDDLQAAAPLVAKNLNDFGGQISDAFRTDTKNMWIGSIALTQPIYMGGRLTALNKIADINMQLTANQTEAKEQELLINTERAYWLVVSLKHKLALAQNYLDLVKTLDGDVKKMIEEGVATKADGLSVDVKVNEAEMAVTQVDNGLSLSRMALCQIIGLPIESQIVLADEDDQDLTDDLQMPESNLDVAWANRPEIKMLENSTDIAKQGIKLATADYMPSLALTGGYTISNPNVFNGFQKKFSGLWNVGVAVQIPVWNWFETKYKIRAAKAASNIASMELADAKELIHLQVNQNDFKLNEAKKRVDMTQRNIKSADENLRAANLGFKEGVMTTSNVLEAQTAWLTANTQKIDALIELRVASSELRKALGMIKY